MANFKDLTNGATIYVVQKQEQKMLFDEGVIVSVSRPRADMPQTPNQIPQYREVVDVTYTVSGKTFTDTVDINANAFSTDKTGCPTLVAVEKESALNEVRQTLKQAEQFIKDIDKQKKRVKDCKEIIAAHDTEYNEKIQTENRLKKLEETTMKTADILQKILDKMDNKLL